MSNAISLEPIPVDNADNTLDIANKLGMLGTNPSLTNLKVLEDSINLGLAMTYTNLSQFAELDNFWTLFDTAFGTAYNYANVAKLRSQWRKGDFSQFPNIEVISSSILGNANGAYGISTNKIYLSDAFVASATPQTLIGTLLEEYGHFVDAQVNQVDSEGDEGAIFAALVQRQSLDADTLRALKAEDDHGVIALNGQVIQVEQQRFFLEGFILDYRNGQYYLTGTDQVLNITDDLNPKPLIEEIAFSSSTYTVKEYGTAASITLERTYPYGIQTVTVTPSDGTARAPSDYDSQPIVVSFNPGETGQAVIIPIVDDSLVEGNETVNLTLSNPTGGATLGTQSTATLTIVDNDNPSTINLGDVTYNTTTLGFLIRKNIDFEREVGDTSTAPLFYQFSLTQKNGLFLYGSDLQIFKADNTPIATLSNSVNSTSPLYSDLYFLNLDPGAYYLKFSNVPATGPVYYYSRLQFSPPDTQTNTFQATSYPARTQLGTLGVNNTLSRQGTLFDSGSVYGVTQANQDNYAFTLTNDAKVNFNLTFLKNIGQATLNITTPVEDVQGNRGANLGSFSIGVPSTTGSVEVNLRAGTYFVDLSGDGTDILVDPVNIIYNESPIQYQLTLSTETGSGKIAFSRSTYSVNENGTTVQAITLTRTNGSDGTVTVKVTPSNGTATQSSDYNGTPIVVSFNSGQTSQTVTIPIINDTQIEGNETVNLTLSNPTGGATLGTQTTATLTIIDNDNLLPNITLTVNPTTVIEDGTPNLVYTFTRTGATTNALTVNYNVGGTATFNTDYTPIGSSSFTASTGSVTFAPGSAIATVEIDPTEDTTVEADETVALTLATGTGYAIGTTTAVTGTITNDDIPTVSVSDAYVSVNENQNTVIKFRVTLSQPSNQDVVIVYSTSDQLVNSTGQKDAKDYQSIINGTLTFAPGETTKEIAVTVFGERGVSDQDLEIFAKDTAYRNWEKEQDKEQDVDKVPDINSSPYGDLGYYVDQVFNDPKSDFQAVGLTSNENFSLKLTSANNATIADGDAIGTIYDLGKAPILASRGTATGQDVFSDANPNGVGFDQYIANKNAVETWLKKVSQPENGGVIFRPNLTGHSLGGALTQLIASNYTGNLGKVVTFNSPGINSSGTPKANINSTTHYITSSDVVSMAGLNYLPGSYVLSDYLSFDPRDPSSLFGVANTHLLPVLSLKVGYDATNIYDIYDATNIKKGFLKKPTGLLMSPKQLSSNLSNFFFTYLPDPDYFAFQVAVSHINPEFAKALTFRGTTEASRIVLGTYIYSIPFLTDQVIAAWNAASKFSSDIWNKIIESTKNTLNPPISNNAPQFQARSTIANTFAVPTIETSSETPIDLPVKAFSEAPVETFGETPIDPPVETFSETSTAISPWEAFSKWTVGIWNASPEWDLQTFTDAIEGINTPPGVENTILDQVATEDNPFSFTFAESSFIEIDPDDPLTYFATLADGNSLPTWLSFDPITRTFSGTPKNSDIGSWAIDVRATDNYGVSVTDTFLLDVKPRNIEPSVTLSKISDDIFNITNSIAKSQLQVTLTGQNSHFVNELGVFTVDDAQGKINGIAPGAPGYTQAALERTKVIFSAIANLPNGFNNNNLTHLLEFNSGDNFRFYLLKNSTNDAVKAGVNPLTDILFSDPLMQKIKDLGNNNFSLAWKDGSGNNAADFNNLVVKIQPTNDSLPLGTNLQSKFQGEVIDLRGVTSQVKADFVVNREAAFNNFIGFYQVTDENGGIDTNGDGKADIFAGQAGYIEAATRGRVAGIDLTVNNQGTATYTGIFQPGSIFAPFIIVNGKPDALLDSNPNNDPAVYFPFLGANADQVDHIRLLGNNIFGFEDLPNGGDKDFNDVIVRINLNIA
ncbi:Calx-beta domain-containing protein [Anabaena sp. UHCC 0451]|uniref:Calx-beta domain-containing protein n=1 Tax=Anabaena sp. UHCC 0451 TaxID=2055235 RepID=UPI002B20424F|nr:Calx-beta domain-containing protein [Anabaena sp. UHCC 0451]MEA5578075.1 Calx-beta domain-containing protein [Anabaena sp. UHCC 0451]